jgi:hypothetical protein
MDLMLVSEVSRVVRWFWWLRELMSKEGLRERKVALSSRLHVSPSPPHFQSPQRASTTPTASTYFDLARGKMPREAEISVNEREFIKQALQEQIRLDGRAFDAFRKLELTFGQEYGVADVQLGKTRYVSY